MDDETENVRPLSKVARSRPRPMAVRKLPAQDLTSPAMAGYLERKSFNGQWIRYWYMIKDGCLYCYLTPEDMVTVDVTDLHGYTVTSMIDKFRGKRFVIHLHHDDYISVYLSLESREEQETWVSALQQAVVSSTRRNENDDHNKENGHQEKDHSDKGGNCDRREIVKQKLLAEVLRQKEELEKNQAAREQRRNNAEERERRQGVVTHGLGMSASTSDLQISNVTRLKQRRMSTQIKMNTIQKQMGSSNGHKRSLFHFGKKKSQDEKNPHLSEQLKELSVRLHQIDLDLTQHGARSSEKGLKSAKRLTKQLSNENSVSKSADTSDSAILDDSQVHRSNSLKASMQRLAHRTFAKAGWRKNHRKSHSIHFDEYVDDQEYYNANQSSDFIDLTRSSLDLGSSCDFSLDLNTDGDQENPDTSRSNPDSNRSTEDSNRSIPLLSLPAQDKLIQSARTEGLIRSYSAGPGLNGMCTQEEQLVPPVSPRREINPSVMAEIEAFEDFTRQMLGQKVGVTSH